MRKRIPGVISQETSTHYTEPLPTVAGAAKSMANLIKELDVTPEDLICATIVVIDGPADDYLPMGFLCRGVVTVAERE